MQALREFIGKWGVPLASSLILNVTGWYSLATTSLQPPRMDGNGVLISGDIRGISHSGKGGKHKVFSKEQGDENNQIEEESLEGILKQRAIFNNTVYGFVQSGDWNGMSTHKFAIMRDVLGHNIEVAKKGWGDPLNAQELIEQYETFAESIRARVEAKDTLIERLDEIQIQLIGSDFFKAYRAKDARVSTALTSGFFNCDSSMEMAVMTAQYFGIDGQSLLLFDDHVTTIASQEDKEWKYEHTKSNGFRQEFDGRGLRADTALLPISYLLTQDGFSFDNFPDKIREAYSAKLGNNTKLGPETDSLRMLPSPGVHSELPELDPDEIIPLAPFQGDITVNEIDEEEKGPALEYHKRLGEIIRIERARWTIEELKSGRNHFGDDALHKDLKFALSYGSNGLLDIRIPKGEFYSCMRPARYLAFGLNFPEDLQSEMRGDLQKRINKAVKLLREDLKNNEGRRVLERFIGLGETLSTCSIPEPEKKREKEATHYFLVRLADQRMDQREHSTRELAEREEQELLDKLREFTKGIDADLSEGYDFLVEHAIKKGKNTRPLLSSLILEQYKHPAMIPYLKDKINTSKQGSEIARLLVMLGVTDGVYDSLVNNIKEAGLGSFMMSSAEALGKTGDPRALDVLRAELHSSKGYWNSIDIAKGLYHLGDTRGKKFLYNTLSKETQQTTQFNKGFFGNAYITTAALFLAEQGDEKGYKKLVEILQDEDKYGSQEQLRAAIYLGMQGDVRAIPALEKEIIYPGVDQHIDYPIISKVARALVNLGEYRD